MKASYKVVKTINGHRSGNVLDQFDNIEDARKYLIDVMSFLDKGSDTRFIADEEDRQAEIDSLNDLAKEEGVNVASEINKIKSWTVPCLIDQPSLVEICNTQYDRFYYDNYSVEIEVEEATCEPFEPGTSYPVLTQDEQGNNKWVDYTDGSNLVGLSYINDFASMGEGFQSLILDNTKVEDHEAIEDGQVWSNDERTMFAVFYGE